MKKLVTIALLALSFLACQTARAQFKVHSDGQVSVGDLTKTYGIQVQPNGYAFFKTKHSTAYGWASNSFSNKCTILHWMVTDKDPASSTYNELVFSVRGYGTVWAKNNYTYGSNHTIIRDGVELIDKEEALSAILQLQGCYYQEDPVSSPEEIMESECIREDAKEAMIGDLEKRTIGLDVSLLGEAFPDAVRTDTEARLCMDNNAIIALLVEAIKQQQVEIELLQKALREKESNE